MRILLTLHNFLPEQLLGTESAAIAQMREMLRAGHQIALFYAGNAPPALGQLASLGLNGIELFRVPYRPTKAQVLLSIRKPHVERAFLAALRTFHPDVIVFHHLVRLSLQLPVLAADAGIPAAYVLHDYYWLCPSYSLFAWDVDVCPGGSPRRCATCLHTSRYGRAGHLFLLSLGVLAVWWRNRVVRRVLPTIPVFITPSAALVGHMAKRGMALTRSAVVRNGQEPVTDHPAVGASPSSVRFGYIGIVSPKKGLDVLAEAFRGALGRKLTIRGFPSEVAVAAFRAAHPALEAKIECFDPDRASFYQTVDVVVVPSIWLENQPMVILEAFAHGRPVLASRIGGLPEMFREGQGGRFFTAGDARSLRRIASELAADPLAVVRLAQSIPRWPNWMEVTATMLRQLDLLLQKGRGA